MDGPGGDACGYQGLEPEEVEDLSSSAGWLAPRYVPTARGGATCAGSAVELGQVTVTRETWEAHSVHVTAGVPDGWMGLFLREDEVTGCYGWGRSFGLTQLGVAVDAVEATLGAGSQILAAVLTKDQIERTAHALGLELDPARLLFSGLLNLSADASDALRRAFAELLDVEHAQYTAEEATSQVLATICDVLSGPDPVRLSTSRRLSCARVARDYIEANLTLPLRFEELALAINVDIRRVQRAFRDVFGMSPYGYLHCRRLMLARHRLRGRDARSSTVTRIAGECGFRHLGRFSVDYRAMFGEPPSLTLSTSKA